MTLFAFLKHPRTTLSFVIAATGLFATTSFAQVNSQTSLPKMQAYPLSSVPVVDGKVTGDGAWSQVMPAQGFWQTRPNEGRPATQETQVFIGYTDDALYIGVICFDENPEQIIVTDSRRDSSLDDTDSFQVLIDAFQDKQNGFVFGTNPAGIEYDGQVAGEGGGSFSGGGGSFNLNWDTTWEVEAQITEQGWSAEMEIPFKALRYPNADVQSWGINFQRNIRRNNEVAYWSPLPRQYDITRISLAGTIDNVKAPPQQNFKFTPYVLNKSERGGTLPEGTHSDQEVGFDIKYSVTPSLILDATYNTDFAQVEVDELQVNLDRFSLFFPEKRPFFLENSGYFTVGNPREVELFFSRRIGLVGGSPIPVDGGLRLSGKIGTDTNVGLLHMQTDELDGVVQDNAYTVARVEQQFPNRSSVGFIAVDRDGEKLDPMQANTITLGSETYTRTDNTNRTFGVDGQVGLGSNSVIRGFLAKTDTPGVSGKEHSGSLDYNFNSEDWVAALGYAEVGNEFNPEVGFVARRDFNKYSGQLLRRIRPDNFLGLHEIRPHTNFRIFKDFDGFLQSQFVHVDSHWEWQNGYEVHTGINFTKEGVQTPFNIADVPNLTVAPGNYSNRELQLIFFTDQSAPFSFRLRTVAGGYFSGDRLELEPTLRYRIGEKFTSDLTWSYNDIDLDTPNGQEEINVGRLRLSYSFTPRMAVQALVQYDDRTDLVATNLRFSWLQSANTGFFLVYNEVDEDTLGSPPKGREFILKYSRIFDIL